MSGPRTVRNFLLLLIVYVFLAVPFRSLEFITDLTDVRPVCMLMPVYGLFFGPVGAAAFAVGNVLSDAAAGALSLASVGGFLANFVAVYTFHLAWNRRSSPPTLDRLGDVGRYLLVTLLATGITVAILVPWVQLSFPDTDVAYFARAVTINNTVFALVPGMALIVIMRTQYHLLPYRSAPSGSG